MNNISNRPNEKDQKFLRQNLRNNKTAPEAIFWQVVKGRQIDGLKFRRQYGFGPYVLDFYCPEIRLCIELDGMVHKTAHADEYDRTRTQFLNDNDITVKRFDNDVVYRNAPLAPPTLGGKIVCLLTTREMFHVKHNFAKRL